MSDTTAEATGRDAKGRFTRGNKGGPGNPFARASAQRRAAILEVVSNEDIQDVFRVLLLLARGGNLSAMRLALLYVVGKPEPAVDPDRLDEDELDVLEGQSADPEVMTEILRNLPGETACKFMEAVLPLRGDLFVGQVKEVVARTAPATASSPAPGVEASPVASAPGVAANRSAATRGADATPLASRMTAEEFLVQAQEVLRLAANESTPETPRSTDRKRCETGEMRASERHDMLPLDLAAQLFQRKRPSRDDRTP